MLSSIEHSDMFDIDTSFSRNGRRFDYDDIRLKVPVSDCREAIQKAADILIYKGCITQGYVEEMLEVLDRYGPYFVLAPGIAFAHSRPSASVKRTGLSIITLRCPVRFGNDVNDPVSVVCVIASRGADEHIGQLQRVAAFLGDQKLCSQLRCAASAKECRAVVDELNSAF